MRVLGLDFGDKTVGVAVSDEGQQIARPLLIVRRRQQNKLRQTLSKIQSLCTQYDPMCLVLGYPRNMDGSEGPRCEKTKAFREDLLRRTNRPVVLWDERLSTEAALSLLREEGADRKKIYEEVDAVSAAVILQGYLDEAKRRKEKNFP